MNVCSAAVIFAKSQTSRQSAWDACERGDWMLFLLGKLSGRRGGKKHKKLVLAVCGCAELAIKYSDKNRKVCLATIRIAQRWVNGKATIQQVRVAADAAYIVAYDSSDVAAHAAADAAYAVAHDSDDVAAHAAVHSAVDASHAALAAARAAADAAHNTARSAHDAALAADAARAADAAAKYINMLKSCSDIVRKYYPKAPRF